MKESVTRDCDNGTPLVKVARRHKFPSWQRFLPYNRSRPEKSLFTMVCSVCQLHLKGNATFIEDRQDLNITNS